MISNVQVILTDGRLTLREFVIEYKLRVILVIWLQLEF